MAKLYLRQRIKGLFAVLRLDLLFGPVAGVFDLVSGLSRQSRWIARNRNVPFNDFYSFRYSYAKRFDLYHFLLSQKGLDVAIDYLEFGVYQGASFRWWLDNNRHPDSRFYGFDTFTGLPEPWGRFKAGDMSTMSEMPRFEDRRVELHPGLFQQTLPGLLSGKVFGRRTVVHLDADLYSSTMFVLTALAAHLKVGDVIIFDEFTVPLHEFRALADVVDSYYWDYEVLGAVNNYTQTAIRITGM